MEYTINVKQQNIDEGVPMNTFTSVYKVEVGCMAERAIRDATGDPKAHIGFSVGHVHGKRFHVRDEERPMVQNRIEAFDKGAKVEPFTFHIVMDDA